MPDVDEPIAQAPEPVAEPSVEAIAAAFANPQPYNPNPEPAPVAAPEPVVAADAAPVAPDAPIVAAAADAPVAPDYAAWLKSQELPEDVTVIKTALQSAEALKANQRTPQDVALATLLADPKAGPAYVKLQTTDFAALREKNPEKLLAQAYAHAHPELPAELAKIEAKLEYDAKYGAASFDDPDDPAVKAAKLRLDYALTTAVTTMEGAKTAAREAVLTQAQPQAEGPTAEQQAQQAFEEARATKWATGVEDIVSAPNLEIAYTVDGQEIKLAFDHKNPAFKEAMLDPGKWLFGQVCPDGDPANMNLDRLAEIVALSTQTDTILKNTLSVGKASLGPVIPMTAAVNPITNAPQAPTGAGNSDDMIAAAIRAASGQNNRSSIYN